MSDKCDCKLFCKKCAPELYKTKDGVDIPECRTCQEPAKYQGKMPAGNEEGFLDWPVCGEHSIYLMMVGSLGEEIK